MIKNNSMNNFMTNSYKYNNTNIISKTKSLKSFNPNTYKIKRNNNSLYNQNSQPIKLKPNIGNSFSFDNQNDMNQQNLLEQDNLLNNMIQEYNYFKYLYNYPPNNNYGKNKLNFKLNLKRPTTAPQKNKNKNKKDIIKRQNISLNKSNKNINANDNEEKIFNLYRSNNNKTIQTQIAKRQRQIIDDINIFDKIFKQNNNRPLSPIIKPVM